MISRNCLFQTIFAWKYFNSELLNKEASIFAFYSLGVFFIETRSNKGRYLSSKRLFIDNKDCNPLLLVLSYCLFTLSRVYDIHHRMSLIFTLWEFSSEKRFDERIHRSLYDLLSRNWLTFNIRYLHLSIPMFRTSKYSIEFDLTVSLLETHN